MVPLKYNVRNLFVRRGTTLMTVLGVGLAVWASVVALMLRDGIRHSFVGTSDPLDVIVLRDGAASETESNVPREAFNELRNLPGIARGEDGQPLASGELIAVINRDRRKEGERANLIVRGVRPELARAVRSRFDVVEGRMFRPGLPEAVASTRLAERYQGAGLGERMQLGRTEVEIVGLFEAGGSSAESELWTDIEVLLDDQNRDSPSAAVLRVADASLIDGLIDTIGNDPRFSLRAVRESEYFEAQARGTLFVYIIGLVIATFLSGGGMFAAANVTFAAVSARTREIGTLRALGFRRRHILASFVFETLLVCLLGAGLALLFALPVQGTTTGTANWVTFSEVAFSFRMGPGVVAAGVALAVAMGLVGALYPAWRATRLPIVSALREV